MLFTIRNVRRPEISNRNSVVMTIPPYPSALEVKIGVEAIAIVVTDRMTTTEDN
jgi:hypothetical protein